MRVAPEVFTITHLAKKQPALPPVPSMPALGTALEPAEAPVPLVQDLLRIPEPFPLQDGKSELWSRECARTPTTETGAALQDNSENVSILCKKEKALKVFPLPFSTRLGLTSTSTERSLLGPHRRVSIKHWESSSSTATHWTTIVHKNCPTNLEICCVSNSHIPVKWKSTFVPCHCWPTGHSQHNAIPEH